MNPLTGQTNTTSPTPHLQPNGWEYVPTEKSVVGAQSHRWFWLIFVLHLPLAYLMENVRIVATAHAVLVLLIGLYFLVHDQTSERLIYVGAYIVGAEVLWRMTQAGVFWEYGKLALILLFFLGLLRWGGGKIGLLPVAYLTPLLLSSIYTLEALPINEARETISFNLFGHLAIAVCLAFFTSQKLGRKEILKVLRWLILPIVGISFLILLSIETADFIEFIPESNFVTSGGYGPNQVSALLGLGALFSWLLVLMLPKYNLDRILLLALSAGLVLQAIFTFSRGGVFNILIAAPFASLWLIREESKALRAAFIGVLLISAIAYISLPQLNTSTGGALEARYQDLDTTGRLEIMRLDLNIWFEHILLGVGPGMSKYFRAPLLGRIVASHTEYSRLLAEHGILGLWTILLMAGMGLYVFFKAPNAWTRGVILACMLWALAEMTHAAMRIAAISFLLTLPFGLLDKKDS